MKIRHLLLVFSVLALALGAGIVVSAYFLRSALLEVETAQQRRYQSFLLADELRQSSDDLTRFARMYVVTRDAKYERFFNEVLGIRNGSVPRPDGYETIYWDLVVPGVDLGGSPGERIALASRMLAAGFTTEEFSKLKEAQNRSDELTRLEQVAMNAVKGRFDDGTGSFSIERPPAFDLAVNLLHGEQYHAAKATIMQPIREFMHMVDERTAAALDGINARAQELLFVILALSTALVATVAVASLTIYRRLVQPSRRLLDVAQNVAQGCYDVRSGLPSHDEIGQLAQGFDRMVEKLTESLAQARQAAAELEQRNLALAQERDHSERLLQNILPVLIADRLKKGEATIADTYPEVTVLFADIAGFTELTARNSPRQIVDMLNAIFGLFDQLAKDHHLEKIKTIGDCYMLVGGVPDRSPTHCQQVADFAIAALAGLSDYASRLREPIQIRIGMHTGTVVAGIVGTQKFSFDLWGDVVNLASRLESTGVPGRIHVSDAVHGRLQDDYCFEARGEIELKGRGAIRTWFLLGLKEAPQGAQESYAREREQKSECTSAPVELAADEAAS
jgi:class 3 adenylate cyclase